MWRFFISLSVTNIQLNFIIVRRCIWNVILSLLNVVRIFCNPRYGLSLWSFHVHLKIICVLLLLHGVFCECQLDSKGLIVLFGCYISFLIRFYLLMKEEYWCFRVYLYICPLPLFVLSALFHVFWGSVIPYLGIQDLYVLLMNWHVFHYVICLFIPNISCSEVYFVSY